MGKYVGKAEKVWFGGAALCGWSGEDEAPGRQTNADDSYHTATASKVDRRQQTTNSPWKVQPGNSSWRHQPVAWRLLQLGDVGRHCSLLHKASFWAQKRLQGFASLRDRGRGHGSKCDSGKLDRQLKWIINSVRFWKHGVQKVTMIERNKNPCNLVLVPWVHCIVKTLQQHWYIQTRNFQDITPTLVIPQEIQMKYKFAEYSKKLVRLGTSGRKFLRQVFEDIVTWRCNGGRTRLR